MTKVAHILFSGTMVCALRAGTKTQTRRTAAPRWAAGDLLVVREAFQLLQPLDRQKPSIMMRQTPVHYMADGKAPSGYGKGRPSIHMPRLASRLTLRVQEVRQEPLLDISEADAVAEGISVETVILGADCPGGVHREITGERAFYPDCPEEGFEDPREAYFHLWDHINGQGASDANPQVFATTFEVIEQNIEEVLKCAAR